MPRFVPPLLLALIGLILFGQGAYIHAKALVAQVLLDRAFDKTIATGQATKPWSWADTWPVARIEVKRLHARAIVLAGSSGQALAFGPGHVERTADAGERGVAIYSAHRDTHFAFLQHDLSKGDDTTTAVFVAGGGSYAFRDNVYEEHLEYCSARDWEGNDFKFTVTIRNDTLIQRGVEKVENAGVDRVNEERYVRLRGGAVR